MSFFIIFIFLKFNKIGGLPYSFSYTWSPFICIFTILRFKTPFWGFFLWWKLFLLYNVIYIISIVKNMFLYSLCFITILWIPIWNNGFFLFVFFISLVHFMLDIILLPLSLWKIILFECFSGGMFLSLLNASPMSFSNLFTTEKYRH